MRDGVEVKLSKRAGEIVTLTDLVDEVGVDAARYTLIRYPADSPLTLDLGLLVKRSNDNPVYYVQYAHARVCALMRQLAEKLWSFNRTGADQARALLTHAQEDELLGELMRFPESIEAAAANRAPQVLATYLRELAASFHSYYNAVAILVPEEDLRNARLGLCLAVRQVLANGLSLLGVSAPEKM